MVSRNSRYRKVPDTITRDASGRSVQTKRFRATPQDTTGTFVHTVEDGDRLDHLSYRYYRQPRKWWRICDANPEFMSPQALLGKEPVVVDHFPVLFDGAPPWHELVQRLSAHVGVEQVGIVEEVRLVPQQQEHAGQRIAVVVERYERAVVVIYNRLNIGRETLAQLIEETGFDVLPPETIGRLGKRIVIPSDVAS